MKFTDLDIVTQERVNELLAMHINMSTGVLKRDRYLEPLLMLPDTKQLIALQPARGDQDVDKAYACAIDHLKAGTFSYALFSYSTKIVLASGKTSDALKTFIFTSDGVEISFFTPYEVKGLFAKKIRFERSVFADIKEGVLD